MEEQAREAAAAVSEEFFRRNPFGTAVGRLIEQATDSSLASENWALIMEICDLINNTEEGPRDAVRAIRKRLQTSIIGNQTTMYTLTVLETCVKNCDHRLRSQLLLTQSEFVLQDLIIRFIDDPTYEAPEVVKQKVLSLIQTWAHAFRDIPDLKGVQDVYDDLKSKGVEFPVLDPDAAPSFAAAAAAVPPRQQQQPSAAGAVPQQQMLHPPILAGAAVIAAPNAEQLHEEEPKRKRKREPSPPGAKEASGAGGELIDLGVEGNDELAGGSSATSSVSAGATVGGGQQQQQPPSADDVPLQQPLVSVIPKQQQQQQQRPVVTAASVGATAATISPPNSEQLANNKLRSELVSLSTTLKVLRELLSELASPAGRENAEDLQLLRDLNGACRRLQRRSWRLLECVSNEEITNEWRCVNNEASVVFADYDRYMANRSGGRLLSVDLGGAGVHVQQQHSSDSSSSSLRSGPLVLDQSSPDSEVGSGSSTSSTSSMPVLDPAVTPELKRASHHHKLAILLLRRHYHHHHQRKQSRRLFPSQQQLR